MCDTGNDETDKEGQHHTSVRVLNWHKISDGCPVERFYISHTVHRYFCGFCANEESLNNRRRSCYTAGVVAGVIVVAFVSTVVIPPDVVVFVC